MATDAFTDTDGTELSSHDSNWVKESTGSSANVETRNNQAQTDGLEISSISTAYYYNQTFAAAHYAKVTLITQGLGGAAGPGVRFQASAHSFFYCFFNEDGNVYNGEVVTGSYTDWDGGQSTVPGANDTYSLEVDGSTTTTIYYKVNGSTVATYTGKNALTAGFPGICYFLTFGSGDGFRLDDWEGADVAGGGSKVLPHDKQAGKHGGGKRGGKQL